MSYDNAQQNKLKFISNYSGQRSWTVLDYVMTVSDANPRVKIMEQDLLFSPGKLRKAVLNYVPPTCDVTGECGQGLCVEGEVVEPKQVIFEITKCFASRKFALNAQDLRKLDNDEWGFTEMGRETVNSYMPQLRKELAKQWYSEITMLAGTHADGSEYGDGKLKLIDKTTGVVNPTARIAITAEYEALGLQDPYILGGKDALYYQKLQPITGENANGINISALDNSNIWYDQGIGASVLNDIVNGDHVLTIDPRFFKYVSYSKNAGIFSGGITSFEQFAEMRGTFGPDWGKTTWLDMQSGIVWDLYINYDKCTDIWSWHVELHYDFFVMPPDVCLTEGINGIMKWRTCPEVITECPTGSPITSPGAGTQYSWTPGDIFPFTAYNANINGISTEPNVTVTNLAGLAAMMNANYVSDIFSVSGSDIVYTGFTDMSVNFNDGAITGTFS